MSTDPTTGFRLSLQQEQHWDWRRRGGSSRVRCVLECSGELDASKLRSAVIDTIARHEILRTHFLQPVGLSRPLQAPLDAREPVWDEHDLRDTVHVEQEATLEALWHATGQDVPGFVVGCTLVALSPTRHVLL